jgi:hypothetical protein
MDQALAECGSDLVIASRVEAEAAPGPPDSVLATFEAPGPARLECRVTAHGKPQPAEH